MQAGAEGEDPPTSDVGIDLLRLQVSPWLGPHGSLSRILLSFPAASINSSTRLKNAA